MKSEAARKAALHADKALHIDSVDSYRAHYGRVGMIYAVLAVADAISELSSKLGGRR